jgi:hypothetical protein
MEPGHAAAHGLGRADDVSLEIKMKGVIGVGGEVGLEEATVYIDGRDWTVRVSALPRLSGSLQVFLADRHTLRKVK